MLEEGKTFAEISRLLGCSNKMISNAKKFVPKVESRGRKPVMSPLLVKRLCRQSKKEPFKPATELKKDLNIAASVETIRARLRENNLKACSPRKVPLLTIKHAAKRMKFAKEHSKWPMEKWRNILWTDESKIVLYGGTGSRTFVRRPRNEEYRPMYTKKNGQTRRFQHYDMGVLFVLWSRADSLD